jgi:hypothetical protein
MFQKEDEEKIFKALQHLKHHKHKVVLFHVYDKNTEINFEFDNKPRKFIDVETGNVFPSITEYIESTITKIQSDENLTNQQKEYYIGEGLAEGLGRKGAHRIGAQQRTNKTRDNRRNN